MAAWRSSAPAGSHALAGKAAARRRAIAGLLNSLNDLQLEFDVRRFVGHNTFRTFQPN